ncbi:MAG: DUF3152 domain-containing protein [Micromonosporaceae bacterium]|nr:DUF3152 domain-containing protein [Micromonosporaceae bacterium]
MSARRSRFVVTAVALVALLAGGAFVLDWLAGDGRGGRGPAVGAAPPAPGDEAGRAGGVRFRERATAAPAPSRSKNGTVLSLPGDFPIEGPGTFTYAEGESEELGESGPVRRFRLGVEDGVDEDLTGLAGFVDDTLGAEQGWTAGQDLRLQRVPDGAGHDFTIYLATSATTARMCAEVGVDVIGAGLPEGGVSCRGPGQVILNFSRWRLSVPQFVDAGVALSTYRQMLVNHEVGHELGYGHEACPDPGEPAPVMQQQTVELAGCEPNPWPYLDGRRYTGPPTP